MKWTKIRAGVYRSGKYELRQAKWRASNDGWLIQTDDNSFHDSTRLLAGAKRRAETHAASEAKKAKVPSKAESSDDGRLVIVFDGTSWFVRRLVSITHDLTNDEKVYRCDMPIGKAYPTAETALRAAQQYQRELQERDQ